MDQHRALARIKHRVRCLIVTPDDPIYASKKAIDYITEAVLVELHESFKRHKQADTRKQRRKIDNNPFLFPFRFGPFFMALHAARKHYKITVR